MAHFHVVKHMQIANNKNAGLKLAGSKHCEQTNLGNFKQVAPDRYGERKRKLIN